MYSLWLLQWLCLERSIALPAAISWTGLGIINILHIKPMDKIAQRRCVCRCVFVCVFVSALASVCMCVCVYGRHCFTGFLFETSLHANVNSTELWKWVVGKHKEPCAKKGGVLWHLWCVCVCCVADPIGPGPGHLDPVQHHRGGGRPAPQRGVQYWPCGWEDVCHQTSGPRTALILPCEPQIHTHTHTCAHTNTH